MQKDSESLNPMQRKFVREYAIDLNATKAAIRAGYSERSAESKASQLLRIVKVKKAVDKLESEAAEKAKLKKEDILEGLRHEIMADPLELFADNGELKNLKDIPLEIRRCLIIDVEQVWDETEGFVIGNRIKSIRLRDAGKARELYGRHLGMWTDKLEVSGQLSIADRFKRAIERANAITNND